MCLAELLYKMKPFQPDPDVKNAAGGSGETFSKANKLMNKGLFCKFDQTSSQCNKDNWKEPRKVF